jgi:hypothetical protein
VVTLTATDANGNEATAVDTVIVEDNIAPLINYHNITVQLSAVGEALITATDVDNGSSDACGIASITLDKSVFHCEEVGDNTVTLTVVDNNGNTSTAQATVTVTGAIPSPQIVVRKTNSTGPDANTIFIGYGPQSVRLEASDAGSSTGTFTWNPTAGLSNPSISNPVFTPQAEGDYIFTVTVRNQYGCEAMASATVHVIDVQCGRRSDKVIICHRGQELCISADDVRHHLKHGDTIGKCQEEAPCPDQEPLLSISPNPVRHKATIGYTVPRGRYSLVLYNLREGLEQLAQGNITLCSESFEYEFRANQYREGIYILVLVTEGGIKYERVVVR